jgi:hypothetical protein
MRVESLEISRAAFGTYIHRTGKSMNQSANRGTINSLGFDQEVANDLDGLLTAAERELAALFTAVTELFGSEQARLTAQEWLEEVESLDSLPGPTSHDWRQVTIAVLARRAKWLNASSHSIKSGAPAD